MIFEKISEFSYQTFKKDTLDIFKSAFSDFRIPKLAKISQFFEKLENFVKVKNSSDFTVKIIPIFQKRLFFEYGISRRFQICQSSRALELTSYSRFLIKTTIFWSKLSKNYVLSRVIRSNRKKISLRIDQHENMYFIF